MQRELEMEQCSVLAVAYYHALNGSALAVLVDLHLLHPLYYSDQEWHDQIRPWECLPHFRVVVGISSGRNQMYLEPDSTGLEQARRLYITLNEWTHRFHSTVSFLGSRTSISLLVMLIQALFTSNYRNNDL